MGGEAHVRKKLGRRIYDLRKGRGWTQEEVARRAGLDAKYFGAIERGERNFPIDALAKIAKGLSVDPYQLFFFGPDAPAPPETVTRARIQDLIENVNPSGRRLLLAVLEEFAGYSAGSGKA